MPMDVLVYGANGLVGQAIVSELCRAGLSVRAMVRDVDRAAEHRALGAEVVSADLEDTDALTRAHKGVRAVLLQLPAAMEPPIKRHLGSTAISIIEKAGVERVIYHAAVQIPRRSQELPSFAVTADIEQELRTKVVTSTVIRPTFFLQNLLLPWVTHSIASNGALVYPVPADSTLSWTAAEDVGRVAASIIQAADTHGDRIALGAREAIDGHALARRFSEALNQHIEFVSLPLDQFEASVDAALGAGAGKRIGAIFRFIHEHPDDLGFVSTPFTPTALLPRFEPTAITEWIRAHRDAFVSA